jgi:hypothetical protein
VDVRHLAWALTGLRVGGVPLTPDESKRLAEAVLERLKGLEKK